MKANTLFTAAIAARYNMKNVVRLSCDFSLDKAIAVSFSYFQDFFVNALVNDLPNVLAGKVLSVNQQKLRDLATIVLNQDKDWYKSSKVPSFAEACQNSTNLILRSASGNTTPEHSKCVQFQTIATTFTNRFLFKAYYEALKDQKNLVVCKPGQSVEHFAPFSGNLDAYPSHWNGNEVLLPAPRTVSDMEILTILGINEHQLLNDALNYNKTPHLRGIAIEALYAIICKVVQNE